MMQLNPGQHAEIGPNTGTAAKTIGLALVASFSAIAFSGPAYSMTTNIDLATFDAVGDVSNGNTIIQSGSLNSLPTGGGTGSLEEWLSINPSDLESAIPNSAYGTAIRKSFNFDSGDKFRFNWAFSSPDSDTAFVSISGGSINVITPLLSNPYSYTFANSGSYLIGIGVVDVNDSAGVSTLTLSNVQTSTGGNGPASVPGPLPVFGVAAAFAQAKRLRDLSKTLSSSHSC